MQQPSIQYIYTLADPFTMEVRYVGRTSEPQDRLRAHIYQTSGGSEKDTWITELRAVGSFPIMEVIEEVPSTTSAERERKWIKQYQKQGANLFNKIHNKPELRIIGYKKRKAQDKILAESVKAIHELSGDIFASDRWLLIMFIYLTKGEETPQRFTLRDLAEKIHASTGGLTEMLKRLQEYGLISYHPRTTTITVNIQQLIGTMEEGE